MARSTTIARSATRNLRRWIARLFLLVALIVMLPFALVPFFAVINPPVTMLQLVKAWQGNGIETSWVPINAIARALPTAVVASEDARFCTHSGIDWDVVQKVVEDKLENPDKKVRGASTITMQIAKNLFFPPNRSVLRKTMEVPLALWINAIWSKRRQMEVYLNIVEWAPGIYGVGAAARHHFKKPAGKLTRRDAARLAASLPNPKVRNAGRPGPLTRRLAQRIERRMRAATANTKCLSSG
ncbi:MAG: monofunctional biosynthetic peptidoglycan transglycosylase [Pseudomonadota bacterium]